MWAIQGHSVLALAIVPSCHRHLAIFARVRHASFSSEALFCLLTRLRTTQLFAKQPAQSQMQLKLAPNKQITARGQLTYLCCLAQPHIDPGPPTHPAPQTTVRIRFEGD